MRSPIVLERDHRGAYTVLSCPRGAFAVGAEFKAQAFWTTLRFGYWPNGMMVENAGREFMVVGRGLKKQK
ncbi:hypothetical protein LCGC14_1983980 [marine sediment metagenome]|uniref:Uncharacterized protein n=1 Tax=marine sediment metagenome TaxID=412755 RepID=A0A0F9I557_9ZZZZ